MIFLSLPQKPLNSILNVCNQISPKKSDVDVFTYLKVSVNTEKISFSAINNLASFNSSILPATFDSPQEVEFLVKTDLFTSSISSILDEFVGMEINLDKHTLLLQGSKTKYTLRINTQDLPNFSLPVQNEDKFRLTTEVSSSDFSSSVKSAMLSVGQAKNVYEPRFLSVCLTAYPQDKFMHIVSTDRYRITKNRIESVYSKVSEDFTGESQNFLVPPKNLQLILNAIDADVKVVNLNFYQDYLWVKLAGHLLALRYGEGDYPDYEKIIPTGFACSFVLNNKEVSESLKQVYLYARNSGVNKSINITVDPVSKKMLLKAETEDGNSSESEVVLDHYEGVQEVWSQSFNADYLIDYFNHTQSEKVFWEANPGKPSVLSVQGEKDKQMYLVSGLR